MHHERLVHALAVLFACAPVHAGNSDKPTTVAHGHKATQKQARVTDVQFGREGDARKVQRVIRIEMSDAMRYFPDQIRVKRGETVRFVIRNGGKLPHEMVLGTMDGLKKHASVMKRNGSMEHDEAHAAHVSPGNTGRLVWQFTKSGEFYYGCLVPGHFEAGMIGTVVVR